MHFSKKLELKCAKLNMTEEIDSSELNPQIILPGKKNHQNMSNDENFNESELDSQNEDKSKTHQSKPKSKSSEGSDPILRNMLQAFSEI